MAKLSSVNKNKRREKMAADHKAKRAALKAVGARAGRFALFIPALMKPRPLALRAQLWALARNLPVPDLPAPGLVAIPPPEAWPKDFAAAMGWVEAGPVLLRQGVAERIAGDDVRIHLVKDGDHRLSRPSDLALMITTVTEVAG